MVDWAASDRTERLRYELVDPFTLEDINKTIECDDASTSITCDCYGSCVMSASATAVDSTNVVDGYAKGVRIVQEIFVDGERRDRTIGTFLVDSAPSRSENGRTTRRMQLYAPMVRLSENSFTDDFSRDVGYSVVQEIREIVESEGCLLRVMPGVDESVKHTQPSFFEIGSAKADAIRQLAGWIGCRIGVDANGYVTLAPARDLSKASPSYVFEAGENCIYTPGFDWSDGGRDVLNRVVLYYTSDAGTLRAYAELPDEAPFSRARTGRNRSSAQSVTEQPSGADLAELAKRALSDGSAALATIEITAAQNPTLAVGDVVRFVDEIDARIDVLAMVEKIDTTHKLPVQSKIVLEVI